MKKQRNWNARWGALLLSLLLCTQLAAPALAAQPEQISIGTAQELLGLARDCTLDAWSRGKTVTLTGDISLAGVEFTPIPSFNGTFDGGGHTISGLDLSGSVSPTGLFGMLQSGAVVKNLHVRGSVAPGGARDMAGGIAGINSGVIENCSFMGTVSGGNSVGGIAGVNDVGGTVRDSAAGGSITGKSMTGGIAGKNLGVISGCSNSACVNITGADPGLDLAELDLGASSNLGSLRALGTVNVATDTGGIAGYSTGMVLSCTNLAVIGYQHIGYNVGGIAGRSCGHIAHCENKGAVFGRKDIGGIVGQAEPDIVLNLSAGQAEGLRGNLEQLQKLIDNAVSDAQSSGSDLSSRFTAIGGAIDGAMGHAEDLANQISRFGGSTVAEINRGSEIITGAVRRLDAMSGDITGLSETLSGSFDALGAALEQVSEASPFGRDALDDLRAASEALRAAGGPLKRGAQQISSGIGLLQSAVTAKDSEKLQAAQRAVHDGLSGLAQSAQSAAEAFQSLTDALKKGGLDGAADAGLQLSGACGKMAGGLRQIGDGAKALLDSVSVEDQAAAEAALDQLQKGAGACAQAAREASGAANDLIQALRDNDRAGADDALQKAQGANAALGDGISQMDGALAALEENISVDNAQGQAALETMRAGLDGLTQAADGAAKALELLNAALQGANTEEVRQAMDALSDAVSGMFPALEQFSGGLRDIQNSLQVDPGAASAGIGAIRSGFDTLLAGVDTVDEAASRLEDAIRNAQKGSAGLDGALGSLLDAVEIFQGASDQGTDIFRQAESLLDYLGSVDPIQITYPAGEIDTAANGLFSAMDRLSGEMRSLNSQADAMSGRLADNMRSITAQFQLTMDSLLDAIDEAENRSGQGIVSDTSEEDIDAVTSGKILSSTNRGDVRGDINVGGVAGTMAVEYELDPEDDLSTGAPVYRREYELKAILQKCANYGTVISRRDYAGSICGRVDLGLVTRCGGFGTIGSESGDYVGGVAGFSGGAVRDSFAKCWLSGGDYVGGITGGAADGGAVSRCYSLVRITGHGQYAGAISGSRQGAFQGNYFVSDMLAGLDGVSLSGKAQAMDYSQLLQVEGLPQEFKRFNLRFLAQGKVVKELTCSYGGSFGADVFPDIPPMEGSFGAWDTDELRDLRFDTDVSAVYTPYITALSSGGRRDDGRPVFLAEGLFSSGEDFTAAKAQLPEDEVSQLSGLSFLNRRTLLEVWTLEGAAGTVRYLSPTGNGDDMELYALGQNGWTKLDTDTAGSYLLAHIQDSPTTIAAVSRTSIWWILILTIVLAVAALGLIAVLAVRRRADRKRAKEAQQADNNETAPVKGPERRRKGWLTALIVLVAVLAAGAAVFFATGLKDDAAAYLLLKKHFGKDELTARLSVELQAGEERHYIDTQITRMQVEGKSVTCAEQYGAAVYYCDGLIYLENGQAIEAGSFIPNYPDLLSGVFTLYKGSDITVFHNPSERIYGVGVDGNAALAVLENLLPSMFSSLTQVDLLNVSLVEQGGELAELRFEASGVFDEDEEKMPLTVSAVLKTVEGDGQMAELPTRVRDRIAGGDGTEPITDEAVLRLLEGWLELNVRDPLVADVALSADCGSLVLDEEMVWGRTHADGVEVNSIQKNGHTYYFSKENVYDEAGSRDNSTGAEVFSARNLLRLVYQLGMNGEISCAERNGCYTYALTLDQDGMARVAHTILPDTEKLDLDFRSGVVQVTITDAGVESIRFACGGSIEIVVVDVPVAIEAELRFREPSGESEAEVPEDVLTELSRPVG